MFKFEAIQYLYYLLAMPILALVIYGIGIKRKKVLSKLGNMQLIQKLQPTFSEKKYKTKQILLFLSILLLTFSASNPQWGTKKEKAKAVSGDIFIAFDISQSMMAQDISPSRLDRAKRWTEKLIDNLKGDRIGLILYAGDAYLQSPLTSDYAAIKLFINSAHPTLAGNQGTASDQAIELALKAFEKDVFHQKAIIIISDGEDHELKAISKAKKALGKGIVTYAVGVGTEGGAFIPYLNNGVQVYKKDKEGQAVKSSINIKNLQNIAAAGNGSFYFVNQGQQAIDDISNKLERLERREVEQNSFTEYNSYFQYFLLFGILLCFFEWILTTTKSRIFG